MRIRSQAAEEEESTCRADLKLTVERRGSSDELGIPSRLGAKPQSH